VHQAQVPEWFGKLAGVHSELRWFSELFKVRRRFKRFLQ